MQQTLQVSPPNSLSRTALHFKKIFSANMLFYKDSTTKRKLRINVLIYRKPLQACNWGTGLPIRKEQR